MIDNIKLRFSHTERRNNYGVAKQMGNSSKLVRKFEIPSINGKGSPLKMEVSYYQNRDLTVIDILGSWRKWYFGNGSTRDLQKSEFADCITLITERLSISEKKIRNAKVLKVELGYSIRFRENMGGVINGFVYYKGFDPIYEYGRKSIKFLGKAYSVSLYDKFSEIMTAKDREEREIERLERKRGIYENDRKSKSLLAEKLNKNNFSLRFEVGVRDLEHAPPEISGKINSPFQIIENWNAILKGLDRIFDKVHFAEYNLNVGLDFLEEKGIKELNMYKTHITAIAVGGVGNYMRLLVGRLKSNHRSKNINNELNILNSPPPELGLKLRACRLKSDLLRVTKKKRVEMLMC